MTENEQKIQLLLEQLLKGDLAEEHQAKLFEQISQLSPDPYWSDLVFWSNDFFNTDNRFDYAKFFQKIAEYPNSEHGRLRAEIHRLLTNLFNKNFNEISEVATINQLNTLIGHSHWIDDIFVKNDYKNQDGSFNYSDFLNQILPQPHKVSEFFN
ncbi:MULTISPECIES: hypothetical protein [unclassified Moraxella]|uniref:hypothetical protein n=1 Tax=unclassified Moraxella TaxID=2685852 RepID=UPI003AF7F321